jgi:hypothetical protein
VRELQATIGGSVFTVNDDRHGSLPFVAECAVHLTTYFTTGRADAGECLPSGTAASVRKYAPLTI